MTTLIPFTPNVLAPFTFQPVLDGQTYNASVPWALWGQRWYLNLTAPSGANVLYEAIRESGDSVGGSITTTAGLANAVIDPNGQVLKNFSVTSVNVPDGTFISYMAQNGYIRLSQPALVTGIDTSVIFDYTVNLVAGYGFTSTLVFRASSQTFEVNP